MSMIKFVDLQKNYESIKDEINERIKLTLDRCDFILGHDVNLFEDNFARYLNVKHFIGVGNGTDALEIAVQSLDLKKDDEVIIQSNTFISTCLGVINNNSKCILCDTDPNTFMINENHLKSLITLKTKVLILVHLYGLMPNMDNIVKLCNENNIILIEDCAQAHGAMFKTRKAGTFGRLSCFSFYPGKNLGAYGDGGGIATSCTLLFEKIRKIRNTGSIIKYEHEIIGRNSRLDTIQAGILDVKLKYLDINNTKRREIASLYYRELKDVQEIELPVITTDVTPVWHLFVIKLNKRDALKEYLRIFEIETGIHYPKSIAEHLCFKNMSFNDEIDNINIKNNNSKLILSLPIYPELEHKNVLKVCDTIKEHFANQKQVQHFSKIETKGKPGILKYVNDINFDVKRLFYIDSFTNLKDGHKTRGNHANMYCQELLIIQNGSIKLTLINQKNKKNIFFLYADDFIIIDKLIWLSIEIIQEDTMICVLCDKADKDENIRSIFNFDEFLNYEEIPEVTKKTTS
jgi:dTDP-4-amino-4,6-dideoxygalactose transaminase